MSTHMYAVDWSHAEEKLSVWDGTRITHKLPKAEPGVVLLTENMPNKMAKSFIDGGATVMRCSPNTSSQYREKYMYHKTDDNDAVIIWWVYNDHPQKFRPMKKDSKLKQLYVNYQQLTKQMTAVKNRQWAAEDEDNAEYLASLEAAKTLLLKKITKELKRLPIYETFLSKIKGVGPALAAGLIAVIGDISRFENVSDLYAYCGVHVKDGKSVRRKKGELANWNATGRCLICELVPDQFVKHKSPVYHGIYADEKARQVKMLEEDAKKLPEDRRVQSKLHAERRVRRKVGKIFLHHLWKKWRELEGLPVPQPWVLAHGGHTHEILPPTEIEGLT
jgi:hypothetical protein